MEGAAGVHGGGGPGGFVYVPPFVPHQEINALDDEPLECVLARSGQKAIVVNLDFDAVSEPEHVPWVDRPNRPADTDRPPPAFHPINRQRINDATKTATVH